MTAIETVFARFLQTPAGREIEEKIKTESHERRAQLVAEREQLNGEAEKAAPGLRKAQDDAHKRYKITFAKMVHASDLLKVANVHLWNQSIRHHAAVEKLDSQLIDFADPQIEEARQSWYAECERIRRLSPATWEEKTGRYLGKHSTAEVITHSNRDDILAMMRATTKCAEEIHALRLAAPVDVGATISEIEKDLPELGEFAG